MNQRVMPWHLAPILYRVFSFYREAFMFPQSSGRLQPFKADDFFKLVNDPEIVRGENTYSQFTPAGIALLLTYFAEKYQSQILPVDSLYEVEEYLRKNRENFPATTRIAFIIGKGTAGHSIPVIYCRENHHEILLYADSKGNPIEDDSIKKELGIDTYMVLDERQADFLSCHVDAIVIAYKATALNPQRTDYLLPDLVKDTTLRAMPMKAGHYQAKLSDELLITAQLTRFVDKHKSAHSKKLIGKGKEENLDQFRQRYKEEIFYSDSPVTVNNYLRKRGLKFNQLIEIQFYLEQFNKTLGDDYTNSVRDEFSKHAKNILKYNGNLYEFAAQFLVEHENKHENKKAGTKYQK